MRVRTVAKVVPPSVDKYDRMVSSLMSSKGGLHEERFALPPVSVNI